jgi:hypothetical protein
MRTFEQIRERGGTMWWPLDDGCDDHAFVWPVVVRHYGGPDWSVLEIKARDRSTRTGDILDIEMSARRAMLELMDDPENHARLSGLLAILALPLLRGDDGHLRRINVEILLRGDSGLTGIESRWVSVEGADVEAGKLTIWAGSNGKRMRWEFDATKCPEWRTIKPAPKFLIDDENPSPRLHT